MDHQSLSASSDSLTIFTLLDCSSKHSLQLKWDRGSSPPESFSQTVTGLPNVSIWRLQVERQKLERENVRLVLSVSGFIKTNTYEAADYLRLGQACTYAFLLDQHFPRCSEARVPSPIDMCLILLASDLLRGDSFPQSIPQLLSSIKPTQMTGRCRSDLCKMVDKLVQQENDRMNSEWIACVFAVIGLFHFEVRPVLSGCDTLLQHVGTDFVGVYHGWEKGLKWAVLKGMSFCVAQNEAEEKLEWRIPLGELMKDQDVLRDFSPPLIAHLTSIPEGHFGLWFTLLSQLSDSLQRTFVTGLMSKLKDYVQIFRFLGVFFPLFPFTEENSPYVQKAIGDVRKSGKIAKSSDLECILDIMRGKDDGFKKFFYRSILVIQIYDLLKRPKAADVSLLKRLLITDKDYNIIKSYDRKQFLEQLLSPPDEIGLSVAVNDFETTEQETDILFTRWAESNAKCMDCGEWIVRIDKEIGEIKRRDIGNNIAGKAIQLLYRKMSEKKTSIINVALTIDKLQSTPLQSLFVDCYKSSSRPSLHVSVQDLLTAKVYNPNSRTLDKLIESVFGMSRAPTSTEIERRLIEEDDIEPSWVSLINGFEAYKSYTITQDLVINVSLWGINVTNHSLTIGCFALLKKKPEERIARMCELVAKAFEIRNPSEKPQFRAKLYEAFRKVAEIQETIDTLSDFLKCYSGAITDSEELRASLKDTKENYLKLQLQRFRFPAILACVIPTAVSSRAFLKSTLFKRSFEQTKGQQALTSSSIAAICTEAMTNLLDSFQQLLRTFPTAELRTVTTYFQHVTDWKKEIETIRDARPDWTEDIIKLAELLQRVDSRQSLVANCKNVIQIQELFNVEDQDARNKAETFVKSAERLESLSYEQFVGLCEEAETAIYPDGQRTEGQKSFEVLSCLQRQDKLRSLISALTPDLLTDLQDRVRENEDTYVTEQHILELETLWEFSSAIASERHTYKGLLNRVNQLMKEAKFQGMMDTVQMCAVNWRAMEELRMELERTESAKKKQTELVWKASSFVFIKSSRERRHDYTVEVQYSANKSRPLRLPSLLDLQERASLTIHTHKKEQQRELTVLKQFVELVHEVQRTVSDLNELLEDGYPKDVSEGREFLCENGAFISLSTFHSQVRSLLTEWKSCLIAAYSRSFLLTFLHGQQFWELEEALATAHWSPQASHLIAFMLRTPPNCQCALQCVPDGQERLTQLGDVLSTLTPMKTCEFTLKNESTVAIPVAPGTVLYVHTPQAQFLHALYSLYLRGGKPLPHPHQVLFCTRNSLWSELKAFLHRCVSDPGASLYVLLGCEQLSLELQTAFKDLFVRMHRARKGLFTLAVVIASDKGLLPEFFQFAEELKSQRVRDAQMINDAVLERVVKEVDSRFAGSEGNSTTVITSTTAGQGKSTLIQNGARGSVLRFSLSGNLDLIDICDRLSPVIQSTAVLHLAISHVDSIELLNSILIDICLFRVLRSGSAVVVLPHSCRIVIEVANLQPEMRRRLPILRYLENTNLEFDLTRLVMTTKLREVGQYLHLYDTKKIDSEKADTVNLPDERYWDLVNRYFVQKQIARGQPLSFTAVENFSKILQTSLSHFNKGVFSIELLETLQKENTELGPIYSKLRKHIMKSILQTVEEVSTRCVRSVRVSQELAVKNDNEAAEMLECTLSWEQSSHFSMVFLEDGTYLAIFRKPEMIPESIKKLLYTQQSIAKGVDSNEIMTNIRNNTYKIDDFASLSHVQFLEKLKTFSGRELVRDYAESEYKMTRDNFLKMSLIYLRAVSGLPIIIMGETGCGKTSLVRFFVKEVLNETFEIFNVHAGITTKVLLAFMNNIIAQSEVKSESDPKHRIWVFFDEFNTSDCVGQITEIVCERHYMSKALPKNLVFVAACNPYKRRPKGKHSDEVGIQKSLRHRDQAAASLVHLVKPTPETAFEFIWDFGQLEKADAVEYVKAMLKPVIQDEGNLQLFVTLVCCAQEYFQRDDPSSVSLRDVARFRLMMKWFRESLEERAKSTHDVRYIENCEKNRINVDWAVLEDRTRAAGVLALCNCYYYRVASLATRKVFLELIAEKSEGKLTVEIIESIIRQNENDLLARLQLPEAIALNQAFRENLTCMIHCIFCKIPLFICGKPGCSKSLAIQLVFANLHGDKSSDAYFCTLPELVMVPFQGSESSTSEGVEQVFLRAKSMLKTDSIQVLPVVVFDEIGLAEISKHNPLKVLHSLLELENRDVAFVGVSNWRLDASKMNRAMYLARPSPGLSELQMTATALFRAWNKNENADSHLHMISSLAEAYSDLMDRLESTRDGSFYGLRDFYSMIKFVSYELSKAVHPDKKTQASIIKKAIERNFGGRLRTASELISLLKAKCPEIEQQIDEIPDSSALELINENLRDPRARYLMIISKGDFATYAVDRYINLPQSDRRVLVGSCMPEDEKNEEYSFRCLSDMILYIERGVSVIMKDMDHVYTSLYDLFNQTFVTAGKDKKYCRVALGAQFNPRCLVHPNFHVMVFISSNEDKLEQTDAPFLNRFEKHVFDMNSLFSLRQKEILDGVQQWLGRLMTMSCGEKMLISINHVFPLYSEDYLRLIVLIHSTANLSKSQLIEKCQLDLLSMAPQEVLLVANASVLENDEKAFISSQWNSLHKGWFVDFLCDLEVSHPEGSKSLVFTYDSEQFNPEDFSEISFEVTQESFSSYRSERDLTSAFDRFFQSKHSVLLLLEFNVSTDNVHFSLVKHAIEKSVKEFEGSQKHVVLLVRLMRNAKIDFDVCWFEGWNMNTFDSLRSQGITITQELLSKSFADLLDEGVLFKFESSVDRLTYESFQKLEFAPRKGACDQEIADINTHILSVSNGIKSDPQLCAAIKCKLIELLRKEMQSERWVDVVLSNMDSVTKANNIASALLIALESKINIVFPRVLYSIEKYQAFHSYFQDSECSEQLRRIWIQIFQEICCDFVVINLKHANRVDLTANSHFPFSLKDYHLFEKLYESFDSDQEDASFSDFVLDSDVWRSSVAHFLAKDDGLSPELQTVYLKDFIHFSCFSRPETLNCESMICALHMCLSAETRTFHERICDYFTNRALCFALCQLVAATKSYDDTIKDKLISLAESLFHNATQCEPITDTPSEEQFSDEEHTSPLLKLKTGISALLNQFIEDMWNSPALIDVNPNMRYFSIRLGQLYNLLTDLVTNYDLHIENLGNFHMVTLLIAALSDSQSGQIAYKQIHESAKSKSQSISVLLDSDFVSILTSKLRSICSPEKSERFISIYFFKLIEHDLHRFLPMVVHEVNNELTILWRHSAALLDAILRKCELISEQREAETKFAMSDLRGELEKELADCSVESQFSVLLNDAIVKHFRNISTIPQIFIVEKFTRFNMYCKILKNEGNHYPRLMAIYASAHVRIYIEQYCQIITQKIRLSASAANTVKKIDSILSESPPSSICAYALKYLRQVAKVPSESFGRYLKSHPIGTWTDLFHFASECEEKKPLIPNETVYIETCNSIDNMLRGEPCAISQLVTESLTTVDGRISFALAFLMKIYVKHSKGTDVSAAVPAYTAVSKVVFDKAGAGFGTLVEFFVRNFPPNSLLELHPETTPEELHTILPLCYFLIVVLSTCSVRSPFTSLFFDKNGDLWPDLPARISESYVYGVGVNPLHAYLQTFSDNFDWMINRGYGKQFTAGSVSKCSQDCEYLYVIDSCSSKSANCPFCGREIYGAKDRSVGHTSLTDQAAKTELARSLSAYKSAPEQGYRDYPVGDPSSRGLRGISETTHSLLHVFVCTSVYFLEISALATGVLPPSTAPTLAGVLQREFDRVNAALSLRDDAHLWWFSVISALPVLIQQQSGRGHALPDRTKFEAEFEQFASRFVGGPLAVIRAEKQRECKGGDAAVAMIDELSMAEAQQMPLHFQFFRLQHAPEVHTLKQYFDRMQLNSEYPMLALTLRMQQEIRLLGLLYPVVDITNYLREKFNHKIRRDEAKCRKIREICEDDPTFRQIFTSFSEIWNDICPEELTLNYRFLKKKTLSAEDELIYLLVDRHEEGGGTYMAAAITQLAEIQNRVIEGFFTIMQRKTGLERREIANSVAIPVQEMSEEDVICLSLADEKLLGCSFVNNPQYGRGRETFFNFQRLEEICITHLQQGRFFSLDLDCIQYQFELLSGSSECSGLIATIRAAVKQEPLSSDEKLSLVTWLKKEEEASYVLTLLGAFESLESMLYFLRNAMRKYRPESLIGELAEDALRFARKETLWKESTAAELPLSRIVAVYELIETELFPHTVQYLRAEYSQHEESIGQVLAGLAFSGRECISEAVDALRRMIVRLLLGGLDPEQSISWYIVKADLWSEETSEDERSVFAERLKDVRLKYSLQVYRYFEKMKALHAK